MACFAGLGAKAAAIAAYRITDTYGNILDHVQLSYEGQFADASSIASEPLSLKLLGDDLFGTIRGEAHGCSIGVKQISDGQVALLLDNQREISMVSARHGFRLTLRIDNRSHADGAVQCSQIGIYASRSQQQLLIGSVTGLLALAPQWADGAGVAITALVFNFDGLVARNHAHVDVDSSNSYAKLLHAAAYPATIFLARPAGCRIGPTRIHDADVYFLQNGRAVTMNKNILVTSNALQSYVIRFAAVGGYGKGSGAVTCSETGILTYTY